MEKVLSSRFEQCFGPSIMLVVEASSETGRFRYLSNNLFQSSQVEKYISYDGHLFLKCSKLNANLENAKKKNLRKAFLF